MNYMEVRRPPAPSYVKSKIKVPDPPRLTVPSSFQRRFSHDDSATQSATKKKFVKEPTVPAAIPTQKKNFELSFEKSS